MATEIEYLVRCIMNLLPTYKEKKTKKLQLYRFTKGLMNVEETTMLFYRY